MTELSLLTPIYVRGKRSAKQAARPKRRQLVKVKSLQDSSLQAVDKPPRKKRRQHVARLEDLPTEVLEIIFLYSSNPDLPLVSRSLVAQLSGRGLQNRLMDATLGVLLEDGYIATNDLTDLLETMLSRRFCTWNFLQAWLPLGTTDMQRIEPRESHSGTPHNRVAWPARLCFPAPDELELRALPEAPVSGMLPRTIRVPEKLLHGPWTEDMLQFLECFFYVNGTHLWNNTNECARMSSFNGLHEAIHQQSLPVLEALLRLGADPEPDILRVAIIDEGCDEAIVSRLFRWLQHLGRDFGAQRRARWPDFDPLDPVLWSWLAKPAQKANGKGEFVRVRLAAMAAHKQATGIP